MSSCHGHKIPLLRSKERSSSVRAFQHDLTQHSYKNKKVLVTQRLWRKKVCFQPFSFESKYINRTDWTNPTSNYQVGFLFFGS